MTIGARINQLRKDTLKLTMDEFGNRLGVQKSSISKLENGVVTLSDQMCRSICREFHVNETWLRTGEGEMFSETADSTTQRLIDEYGLDYFGAVIVREYMALDEEKRKIVRDFIRKLAEMDIAEPEQTIHGLTREQYLEKVNQMFDEKEKGASTAALA